MRFIIIIFIFLSCAQVTSLNLKKHEFGALPTKIVWIQIAGLEEEQLAMLKFQATSSEYKTNIENSLCIGKAWDYDLYRLRPDAKAGFLSQLTGKKNIKNSCEDYEQQPIWAYLKPSGFKTGIFEISAYKNSLEEANTCEKNFLEGTTLWKMERSKGKELTFHQSESKEFKTDSVYYDKSCVSSDCYTSISANVFSTFEAFSKNAKNFLYIVRDFSYLEALSKKNIKEAASKLRELDKVIGHFQSLTEKNKDLLVLITSSETVGIEFPNAGRDWIEFEKNGKNILYKRPALMSSVFASGARAENFCGVYEQTQILERIFSGPDQQGLELKIINPFQ